MEIREDGYRSVDPKLTVWGDGHTLAAPDHPQTIRFARHEPRSQ
ncbi:hypothetical protein GCM10022295_05800 [Streptomyces osmaniensis]|uniref:Uncharacterized protein n=1 Tax=Streptomyces osmaniensis TaxID=593134 RepID=A0ABP6V4C5_9ACTN